MSRPAGQLPSSAGQPSSAGANGKQLDTGNAFGGLINGIFNQALSGFARPAQNGAIGIDLGTAVNPQAGWNIFGSGNAFQPTSPQGGDLNFPGKKTTTTTSKPKATTSKVTATIKSVKKQITDIITLADVPGW